MEFLDKLTKKASETYKGAAEKAVRRDERKKAGEDIRVLGKMD